MNFKNISIIFVFLTFYLNVLSSPVRHCIVKSSKSTNDNEVSSHELDPVNNDSDTEVEITLDNDTDSNSEIETEVGTETETETTSGYIPDDEIVINEECLTPECYETSKSILSKLDITVDPCEDFYQFSCGGWMKENEIPEGYSSIGVSSILSRNINEILNQILEGEYQANKNLSSEDQKLDKEIFNKMKTIYNTCKDEDRIKEMGKEPLIKLLDQFDLYSNKTKYESVDEFTNLIADLNYYGVGFIIGSVVIADAFNNQVNVMHISQLKLLFDGQYNNEAFISSYKSIIMETLNLLFDDQKNDRNTEEMAEKIVEFEIKLSDISIPLEQALNIYDTYNPITVEELMKVYPYINWKLYFDKKFKSYDLKTSVNDDTFYVVNTTPKYFEALNKLLDETDIDTLIYYAEWQIIHNFIGSLSDDYCKPYNDFLNKMINGIDEMKERSKLCFDVTNGIMGNALGKYFVEKTFNGDSKEEVKEMINYIKQTMLNRIPNISWLDQATADYAVEKVNEMYSENIGYPDYILNPKELLKKDYEGLEIDSNVFFNTMVNYNIFSVKENIKIIDEPVVFNEWKMTPQTVNAYYSLQENSINFPAAILQPPYYNVHQPDYLNYGGIGSAIGHELTHAFDNNGRLYDADGVVRDWWTNSTANQFNDLSMCFVDQYNQYKIIVSNDGEEINMNGKQTLGENLADNGGISRAFEAWKLSSKDTKKFNERNKALPGLSDFTAEQLFYVAFGQSFCEKQTPETTKHDHLYDVHSTGKYRVIGVLSNNENFAKVFNCPKNSPMNPEKKCLIW